jgi:hypothetical protein
LLELCLHIDGLAFNRNANDWHLENLTLVACDRHGVFVAGQNANAGLAQMVFGTGTFGGHTIYDRSFLGNTYIGCHSEGAGHSFHARPGTKPTENGVACSTFVGCYQEASDGPADLSYLTTVIGGVWGNGITGTPVMAGVLPDGKSVGFIRGITRTPQAPPIRRWTPDAPNAYEVISGADHTIIIDGSLLEQSNIAAIWLPNPVAVNGLEFTLKRVDTKAAATLRVAVGGGKFDGVPGGTYLLKAGEGITVQTDGVDWFIVSRF